jgi:hypothetical protein
MTKNTSGRHEAVADAPTLPRSVYITITVIVLFLAGVLGAVLGLGIAIANAAPPPAAQLVVAPGPGLTCSNPTLNADGTYGFACTITGLVTPGTTPSPTASPTASPTVTSSPTLSPTATPSPSRTTSTPPPTPSPTVTPSPTPSGPRFNCYLNPGSCGYPDALSTGPSGALTVLNGNQTFTTPGQTIVNTQINGCTEVRASNVTFRNVRFNGNGCGWVVNNFSTGLMVIDSEATCGGSNGTAFGSSSLSLLRVDIHSCENGLNVSGTTTVTESYIHDMNGSQGGAHTDGAQFNQGATDILFQHNTILVGPPNGATSAIIMWDEGGSQNKRVTLTSNLFAGGTYTVYCGREGVVDNIRLLNNRFGPFQYGYANNCNNGETWSGNIRDSDGAQIPAT